MPTKKQLEDELKEAYVLMRDMVDKLSDQKKHYLHIIKTLALVLRAKGVAVKWGNEETHEKLKNGNESMIWLGDIFKGEPNGDIFDKFEN